MLGEDKSARHRRENPVIPLSKSSVTVGMKNSLLTWPVKGSGSPAVCRDHSEIWAKKREESGAADCQESEIFSRRTGRSSH